MLSNMLGLGRRKPSRMQWMGHWQHPGQGWLVERGPGLITRENGNPPSVGRRLRTVHKRTENG